MLFEPGDPLKRSPGFVSFGLQRVYMSFEIDDIMTGISSVDMHEACVRIFVQYDYQFFVLPFLSAVYFHAKLYVAVFLVLIYISTLENHRKAGVGKSPNQSFLFI